MKRWKVYAYSVAIALAVGGASSLLSREGMRQYGMTAVQPPLSPPSWAFAAAWTALYALMGIGAARVWLREPSRPRSRGLNLYAAQLVVNFFWSLLFFNAGAYGFAVLWLALLLILTVLMVLTFDRADALAGKLQIPYVLWLIFALYLNVGVWALN